MGDNEEVLLERVVKALKVLNIYPVLSFSRFSLERGFRQRCAYIIKSLDKGFDIVLLRDFVKIFSARDFLIAVYENKAFYHKVILALNQKTYFSDEYKELEFKDKNEFNSGLYFKQYYDSWEFLRKYKKAALNIFSPKKAKNVSFDFVKNAFLVMIFAFLIRSTVIAFMHFVIFIETNASAHSPVLFYMLSVFTFVFFLFTIIIPMLNICVYYAYESISALILKKNPAKKAALYVFLMFAGFIGLNILMFALNIAYKIPWPFSLLPFSYSPPFNSGLTFFNYSLSAALWVGIYWIICLYFFKKFTDIREKLTQEVKVSKDYIYLLSEVFEESFM